jgi:hypothetical protein
VQAREAHAVSARMSFDTQESTCVIAMAKTNENRTVMCWNTAVRGQISDVTGQRANAQPAYAEGFGVAGAHLSRRSESEGGTPNVHLSRRSLGEGGTRPIQKSFFSAHARNRDRTPFPTSRIQHQASRIERTEACTYINHQPSNITHQ